MAWRSAAMTYRPLLALLFANNIAFLLQGCGGGGGDTPVPLGPDQNFSCRSDLQIPESGLSNMTNKGLAVDDTTLFGCADRIPERWPHTQESIKYMRLFKARRPGDSEEETTRVREAFVQHVQKHGVKVLVGSEISCSEEDDEADWQSVKLLLNALGREHVLALAVGNEIDQLQHHADVTQSCLDYIWDDYLLNQTKRRAKEARELLSNPFLPVTSVFTGEVIWVGEDTRKLRSREWFRNVLGLSNETNGSAVEHFVFAMNFYPYFDPTNRMDADGVHCRAAVKKSRCFDSPNCLTIINLMQARKYLKAMTNRSDDRLWIGELGWSSPHPVAFKGDVANCTQFDGYQTLYEYYKNYLSWDLKHGGGMPPEMVFYFTMRDSSNFGNIEHFGLIEDCQSVSCKLTKRRVHANESEGRGFQNAAASGLSEPLVFA